MEQSDKEYNEFIGSRIRQKREELGISRQELANAAGFKNKSSIAKIETGVAAIGAFHFYAICEYMNVSMESLMGKEQPAGTITINTEKYKNISVTLNEEEADALMDEIEKSRQNFTTQERTEEEEMAK